MLRATWLRLRPRHRTIATDASAPVFRRLADRTHRSHYANLQREAQNHRPGGTVRIQPTAQDFLVWLRRKQNAQLPHTVLKQSTLRSSGAMREVVLETSIFHILAALHAGPADLAWLLQQAQHAALFRAQVQGKTGSTRLLSPQDCASWARQSLGVSLTAQQLHVIVKAMESILLACPHISHPRQITPWIKALTAGRVLDACHELANSSDIPASVVADTLLRTPLSRHELHLQLDMWEQFTPRVCRHNFQRPTKIKRLLETLLLHCISYDAAQMARVIRIAVTYLTSTRSGYRFAVFSNEYYNELIYYIAFTYIRPTRLRSLALPIIRAQEELATHLTHANLDQKGYIGIALALFHESPEKARSILTIARKHFPEPSDAVHLAEMYLSDTPEHLLHSFNAGHTYSPHSAHTWLFLAKKLREFEMLTERRSHALLREIVDRRRKLVISKDLVLALAAAVESVSGIEQFAETLRAAELLKPFENTVHLRYMALLYKEGRETSSRPYLDLVVGPGLSNVECARQLYAQYQRKTIMVMGIMLNGEATYNPAAMHRLYSAATADAEPDDACVAALLRASMQKPYGKFLMWGQLYAPQVAVREFHRYVHEALAPHVPSQRLWCLYIQTLVAADYLAQLADVIRWWEELQFVPSASTLRTLLKTLPREFVERHIKHARTVGGSGWPWPTMEELGEDVR